MKTQIILLALLVKLVNSEIKTNAERRGRFFGLYGILSRDIYHDPNQLSVNYMFGFGPKFHFRKLTNSLNH